MKISHLLHRLGTSALILALVACAGDTPEEHIASARQLIASADLDGAVIELKNTLQKDKQSAEARWLLGELYLNAGDVLSAEKELRHAEKLGWEKSDVTPALARSLLAQGKYAQVNELEGKGLQAQAEASLLASKGLAALAEGKNKRARKLIDQALNKAPQSAPALLAQARLLAIQGDLDGATTALDTLSGLEPENDAVWTLMGDIRMSQQRAEDALEAYSTAIELEPNNFIALLKRAMIYLGEANFEAAQTDAASMLKLSPQHPGANYVQGLIHFQAARYPDAISSLSVAEPAFKQFPLLLFFLGSAQLVEGKLDLAAVQAARFHGISPQSVRGRKLLATIRLQQGNFSEVQDLLRPVLDQNADDIDALNLMANALLRDGKTDEGISMLARVAELQPGDPRAQVRLGAGLLLEGKSEDASKHMETALALNPEFQQADILLVLNHLQNQDYEAAITAAKSYRRRNLTSATPLNLLGRVYLAAGREEEAVQSFEKALKFDAGDPAANHNLAQLAVSKNELSAARQYYETILQHRENHLAALIQLAMLDEREQQAAAMIAHLEQAMKAYPEALEPRLMLGRHLLREGSPEKVSALFSGLPEAQQQSPQVLHLLALTQLSSQEHENAQFTLEQLAGTDSIPDTAPLRHLKAMAAAGTGDLEAAKQELAMALALDENYLPSRIAMAKLSRSMGQADEFLQHLEKLVSLAPNEPEVLLLQAAAAHTQGDATAAIGYADQAYRSMPATATVLALATYHSAAGDGEAAQDLYRSWIKEHPDDVAAMLSLANTLQLAQEIEETQVLYGQILKIAPDNVVALNNMAWYLREEDPAAALEYIRHASSLAPESADVLDTLAVVEYANKDYKKAQRSVQRALSKSPDNPSMIYHSAMISAALGDAAGARKTLEKLFSRGEEFPEQAEAQALLQELSN